MVCINKYYLLFIFQVYFGVIYSETLFSNELNFAKTFKLNNGNFVMAGDKGINTYDNTGENLLYSYIFNEVQIKEEEDGYYTNIVQFPNEYNGLVIVLVYHILYYLNSNGNYLYKYELNLDFSPSNFISYSIVPYIFKENKYHFILGYINTNQKACLLYYVINSINNQTTNEDSFIFDENDEQRSGISYDYVINCEIMNHNTYGNILICFYQTTYPKVIEIKAFKLENKKIEIIPNINCTYEGSSYGFKTFTSSDKKKCFFCYLSSINYENKGYCALYDIDKNEFVKHSRYLSQECALTSSYYSFDYIKETKEYIFSCANYEASINLIKFDQNFNVINIESDGIVSNDTIFKVEGCYQLIYYSFVLISQEYKIIGFGDFGQKQTGLVSIPSKYKPETIYTDIDLPYDNKEEEFTSLTIDETQSESIIIDKIKSALIINEPSSSLIETNKIKSTLIKFNTSTIPSYTISSIINDNLSTELFECKGYKNNEGTICSENVPIGYYIFDMINKILGKCHISCESCNKGPENGNNNCLTCNKNFELKKNKCLYKYNYYYNSNKEIIYLLKDQLCPEILPYEIVESKECVEYCDDEELMNKLCIINDFTGNNYNIITDRVKNFVNSSNNIDYDVIIDGNNVFYEVTTTATSNNYYNISSIDFGDCESILKKHYKIDYLIVFKMDVKLNNSYSTVVQYEVYSPDKKELLNLSLCNRSQIELLVPVYIDEETNNKFDFISKEGYDMFNENSSFYKDICTPFTTEDGTDILLYDRHNTYYNENIVLCEDSCVYVNYNTTTRRAKCQCQVKKEMNKKEIISLNRLGSSILFDIKSLSNIEIIKCYKLTFSKSGQTGNYGSLLLIFMIIFFIVLIIIFFINEKYSISNILRKALSDKGNPPKKVKTKLTKNYLDSSTKSTNKNANSRTRINNSKIPSLSKEELIGGNQSHKGDKKKNKISKKLSVKIKNYQNINIINKADILVRYKKPERFSSITNLKKSIKKVSSISPSNINKIKEKFENHTVTEKDSTKINKKINPNQKHNEHYKKINYNDEELNTLSYKKALLIDKRTYFEYYWSLLKKKHIILFIFMPDNDYNLMTIKLGLFIFSFCLYLTVNALFFTDKTMHKIYEDKGIFNILFQLPQIIYSTLISAIINLVIKLFALSEKDVIKLRQIKNKSKAFGKSLKLFKWLIIKFNLFFFISILLLMFFWYYVSTFCAVYKNTQKILIKNTLTSFGLTLLYPFGLNLLPGLFRIPSLRTPKKDRACMYKFSNILSLV